MIGFISSVVITPIRADRQNAMDAHVTEKLGREHVVFPPLLKGLLIEISRTINLIYFIIARVE